MYFVFSCYTDKKENNIFLIYKEIQSGAVAKSYMRKGLLIWGNAQIFHLIWRGRLSYMTLLLLHSEFPYIGGKFDFLFYQCKVFFKNLDRGGCCSSYAVLLEIDLVSCPCGATRELSSRTITLKAYPGPPPLHPPPPPTRQRLKKSTSSRNSLLTVKLRQFAMNVSLHC